MNAEALSGARRRALALALVVLATGCSAPAEQASSSPAVAALSRLSPASLPSAPHDVTNRFADDPAAAAFGKTLFFDKGFSGPLLDSDNDGSLHTLGKAGEGGKVACAGCHVPEAGFLDNRSARQQVSLAAGWGKRRARSLLDVGQATLVMWDGRHDALYNQPLGPLESAVEMNSSRLYAAEQMYARHRATYEAIFGPIPLPLDDASRFPQLAGTTTGCRALSLDKYGNATAGVDCHGMPGDGAEFDQLLSDDDRTEVTRVWINAGKAIAAYLRLLSCGPSRFDQWMRGATDALSAAEQRGAALFVGQREDGTKIAGCDTCHSGPFLTDQGFHNVGLEPSGVGIAGSFIDADDHGAQGGLTALLADPTNSRGAFSDGDDGRLPDQVAPSMDGAFRTPSLRCVARRPSYMHNGQFVTLDEVVMFFDQGGRPKGYPGISENYPRHFSASERSDLVAFLHTLDGPGPPADLLAPP